MTKVHIPFVIGVVVAAAFLLLGIGLVIYGRIIGNRAARAGNRVTAPGRLGADRDRRDSREATKYGWRITAATVVLSAFVGFPYSMEYHQYTHVAGTLTAEVGTRVITQGVDKTRSVSQVYAVPLATGVYRCDDTRCSLLHKGDQVGLWCIRVWQWASTPGWACRFDRSTSADGLTTTGGE